MKCGRSGRRCSISGGGTQSGHAVAHRLAVLLNKKKEALRRVDDDGAGRLRAGIVHELLVIPRIGLARLLDVHLRQRRDRVTAAHHAARRAWRRDAPPAAEQEFYEAATEIDVGLGRDVAHRRAPLGLNGRLRTRRGSAWRNITGRRPADILGVALGRERQRFGMDRKDLGRNDADDAQNERRKHMTIHRRTLYWFRRTGIAPASVHYMVKNVLIGKNTVRRASPCTIVGRFVALRFILRQRAGGMVNRRFRYAVVAEAIIR
jgi:hypothetical protein